MREIKFRAWHRGQKRLYDVLKLDFRNANIVFAPHQEPIGLFVAGMAQCDLEQYIGIKDNKGREIYESDIIHYKAGTIDLIASVGWCGLNLCWALNPEADNESYHTLHACLSNDYEVIGNIHENPELLKEV